MNWQWVVLFAVLVVTFFSGAAWASWYFRHARTECWQKEPWQPVVKELERRIRNLEDRTDHRQ